MILTLLTGSLYLLLTQTCIEYCASTVPTLFHLQQVAMFSFRFSADESQKWRNHGVAGVHGWLHCDTFYFLIPKKYIFGLIQCLHHCISPITVHLFLFVCL